MHEHAVARLNVAHQLGGDQLFAALLVVAAGIGSARAGHGQHDGDVAAGDAARLGTAAGRRIAGRFEEAHWMLDSATACSSSVNVWPIISSIDSASAASFSSTFDIAKPTWMRT